MIVVDVINLKNRFFVLISIDMKKLNNIVRFLNDYLKINEIKDDSWNGLQFEGKEEVKRIGFAVDSGLDVVKKATEEKVDMLIVHHGLFWSKSNPSIAYSMKEKIKKLFDNDISLYASHLPLDMHKETGNNAQLLKLLGAKINGEFVFYDGKNIGWLGKFIKPVDLKFIKKKINDSFKVKCYVLPFGKRIIETVAVCSGGGDYKDLQEAIDKGVDLFLTGDRSYAYHAAKDFKINVIFAGHYSTETVGVKALAEVLKKKFKIETVFIDIPTDL